MHEVGILSDGVKTLGGGKSLDLGPTGRLLKEIFLDLIHLDTLYVQMSSIHLFTTLGRLEHP